jgi:hypothetical protein
MAGTHSVLQFSTWRVLQGAKQHLNYIGIRNSFICTLSLTKCTSVQVYDNKREVARFVLVAV